MLPHQPVDRRPDYRPPEPPSIWHEQDWLLVLVALDEYVRSGGGEVLDDLTDGQELRLYQLAESIARMHGTVSLGAVQHLDIDHFRQYARTVDDGEEIEEPGDR